MKLIAGNNLTDQQYNDCKKISTSVCFFDNDLNALPDFPTFYMLYDNDILVSYMSVFIPNEEECEIYSHTLSDYPTSEYISPLLDEIMKNTDKYNIKNIYLVCQPDSYSKNIIEDIFNGTFEDSEYLLQFDPKYVLKNINTDNLTLKCQKDMDNSSYTLLHKNNAVCFIDVHTGGTMAIIHDVFVPTEFRHKGFGTNGLILVLQQLLLSKIENICLHVSGSNTNAYNMYIHNGFKIKEQIDYWRLVRVSYATLRNGEYYEKPQ